MNYSTASSTICSDDTEIFRIPLELSSSNFKQGSKIDYEESSIVNLVNSTRDGFSDRTLFFLGRVLVGVVKLLAFKVDSFESRIQSVMVHIDKVLAYDSGPKERKPRRPPNSVRRQSNHNAVTLPIVPETDAVISMNLEDVIFDNTIIPTSLPLPPVSQTPGRSDSGRKRRISSAISTPSRRRFPSSPFDNMMVTPDGFSLDSENEDTRKRSRRMSSISEVMDSLREDDGTRRLSGLMGSRQPRDSILTTAGNSALQTPDDLFDIPENDDWDNDPAAAISLLQTPLQPVSLIQVSSAATSRTRITRRAQGPPTIKSLMDKKGKRGIEMDQQVLTRRKNQLLDFNKKKPFYLSKNPLRNKLVFPISDFYRDFSSLIRWYVPEVPSTSRRPTIRPTVQPEHPETPDDSFDLGPVFDDHVDPVVIEPGSDNSFLDKIARSKNFVAMTSVLDRSKIVADFVKSLHYVSEGILRVDVGDTTSINLNSVKITKLGRGPRWESFITS